MKRSSLERRLEDLEDVAYAGWIPTTDRTGARTWIKDRGCGIRFMFEVLKWRHDGGELTAEMKEELDLWSRAESDERHGAIIRANRELARNVLGL
jgi:hypothetical protein